MSMWRCRKVVIRPGWYEFMVDILQNQTPCVVAVALVLVVVVVVALSGVSQAE